MSNTKMLIDATHPEETQVVVQRNGRVEEFDFESAARKLLRGNIYLAKVTRVEPSLQAAFVDYGGNRHGFLAFNEIHSDYYQIPVADRQALLDEEAAAEAELEAAADRRAEALARRNTTARSGAAPATSSGEGEPSGDDDFGDQSSEDSDEESAHIVNVEEDEHIEEIGGEEDEETVKLFTVAIKVSDNDARSEPVITEVSESEDALGNGDKPSPEAEAMASVEHDGGHFTVLHDHDRRSEPETEAHTEAEKASEDAHPEHDHYEQPHGLDDHDEDSEPELHEEALQRQRRCSRSYKIQEVIKRRQIILVQVVKEERGNKGAALTTYLSLAGRYTVLMPNTGRGGGISRKITNPLDRRSLKAIAQELEVPEGMGLIIRTASAARTKQEIKRDFEYLLRLWESVRELTLQSTAPSLVYEEGNLIKRSIRDLYNKDVEEVVVAGEAGHQEAVDFMRMLMPSHAKNVVPYYDATPLFTRYGVERQLDAMFQPQVALRSGGYIVINQTEALVAIDVNSGKSTREFSIEETALATNLEAADEIARQLKLRDLAGLIVIDFIDMEEKRNNCAVERRLKDALRFDRARIQLGRISHFGLMELSRQRLRTGVLEGSTAQCPHCQGTGIIRSTESIALAVLRGLEDTITAGATGPLIATTTSPVALYILNNKRVYITEMEHRYGYSVTVLGSDRVQGANFTIERGGAATPVRRVERAAVNMDWGFDGEEEAPAFEGGEIEPVPHAEDAEEGVVIRESGCGGDAENGGQRGRRRRYRGRDGCERVESRKRFGFGSRGEGEEDSWFTARTKTHGYKDDYKESETGPKDGEDLDAQPSTNEESFGEYAENGANGDKPIRRRRRGRRGGRRSRDRGREGGVHAEGSDSETSDGKEQTGSVNGCDESSIRAGACMNGGLVAEALSPDDVAGAVKKTDIKVPRRRIWNTPSKARDADELMMLEGTAHEVAADKPPPATEAPVPVVVRERVPAPRRRHEAGSSKLRIERIIVRPGDDDSPAVAIETQAAPQRKGWWQRKFGGE